MLSNKEIIEVIQDYIEEDKYDWLFTCNNFYTYTYDNPKDDNLYEMDIIYADHEED